MWAATTHCNPTQADAFPGVGEQSLFHAHLTKHLSQSLFKYLRFIQVHTNRVHFLTQCGCIFQSPPFSKTVHSQAGRDQGPVDQKKNKET